MWCCRHGSRAAKQFAAKDGFLPSSTRAYADTIEGRRAKEILVGADINERRLNVMTVTKLRARRGR